MLLNELSISSRRPHGWAAALRKWSESRSTARLWRRDANLWSDSGEERWMGWLDIVERQQEQLEPLLRLQRHVAAEGFDQVLLLGMGGSSLAPEVIAETLGFSNLRIVDSTDPAQVAAASAGNLARTLVFVSSKSGSTLEPDILRRYFYSRIGDALGRRPGDRFCAVTDPGSDLERIAARDGYREIFYGVPEIGGRFSALSAFGMAPAAAVGVDVADFLGRARAMARACRQGEVEKNPGALLGLYLGLYAEQGRDKLTILASDGLRSLGAWLEQLLAESTGKQGKAIIPVDLEPPSHDMDRYGDDRVFVGLELGEDAALAQTLQSLGKKHPVARIRCGQAADLAQEFFRWQIATAVAGSVMGVNPFDQPDVQASKEVTRQLTAAYEESGRLPAESAFFEADGVRLYAPPRHAVELARAVRKESLGAYLKAHFASASAGDYVALLAYLERNAEHAELLQEVRARLVEKRGLATCLGFGPRFLHSTGQAYKGGPNSGVFLQITADSADDLSVPGKPYTFGVVEAAQARGDFQVLVDRRRRALRVHLSGGDATASLQRLVKTAVRAIV